MEALPYIDEHVRRIDAPAEHVWRALLAVVRSLGSGVPALVTAAWGLEPRERTGDWDSRVSPGDTIVGFGVSEASAPRVLTLRGRHRFSRYELRFEITGSDPGGAVLQARTSAVFPGAAGALYRALVIGTHGHRVAVRAMLARVARAAAASAGG